MAEAHFAECRVPPDRPPPWLRSWLLEAPDPVGCSAARWFCWLSDAYLNLTLNLTPSTNDAEEAAKQSIPASDALLERVVLLRGSR